MAKDYYNILGVNKKASKDEIKKAFRKLAHEHHPDKKGGNADKFKEINEAYSILSDDSKRSQYDMYGQTFSAQGGGASGWAGSAGSGFEGFDFSGFQNGSFRGNPFGSAEGMEGFDLSDIFGEFFGGGRKSRVRRGRDISIDIELSFEEVIFGGERTIVLNKSSECTVCKGSGAKPGSEKLECKTCNGKGKIHETKRSIFGSFQVARTCDECLGSGKVPKEKCSHCNGVGIIKGAEEIKVKIPTGVENGEMIRLGGAGEAAPQSTPGDLYVKIHVRKHKIFRKENNDLVMDLEIKLSDALLGAEYKIETLDGPIALQIPMGSNTGDILRIKGKGVPTGRNRGDILAYLNVKLPKKLSKGAREAVEKLKEEGV